MSLPKSYILGVFRHVRSLKFDQKGSLTEWLFFLCFDFIFCNNRVLVVLLMEEIPNNHLGCIKYKTLVPSWDKLPISWLAGFQRSAVVKIFVSFTQKSSKRVSLQCWNFNWSCFRTWIPLDIQTHGEGRWLDPKNLLRSLGVQNPTSKFNSELTLEV